jgi:hypothetical protein
MPDESRRESADLGSGPHGGRKRYMIGPVLRREPVPVGCSLSKSPQQFPAGLLGASAGLGTDPAVGMHPGVPLALVAT